MKAILRLLGLMIGQLISFVLFFMLLGPIAVLAGKSVLAVTASHWLGGVLVGTIWLIGVLTLLFLIRYALRPSAPAWLRNYMLIRKKTGRDAGLAEQFPAASLSALICVGVLAAVYAEPRFLLRDRDTIYGAFFRRRMRNMGIEEVITNSSIPMADIHTPKG